MYEVTAEPCTLGEAGQVTVTEPPEFAVVALVCWSGTAAARTEKADATTGSSGPSPKTLEARIW